MAPSKSSKKPSNKSKTVSAAIRRPTLPNEVWRSIFGLLEHQDLRQCMQVDKFFNLLTRDPTLDPTLFRGPLLPDGEAIRISLLQLHPAFDNLCYECSPRLDGVCFMKWASSKNYFKSLELANTGAANELATSPGVKVIHLQIHNKRRFKVQNDEGVTVLQVMKAVCFFFAGLPTWEGYTFMGDHTGWTGWDDKELTDKGELHLSAHWFDS